MIDTDTDVGIDVNYNMYFFNIFMFQYIFNNTCMHIICIHIKYICLFVSFLSDRRMVPFKMVSKQARRSNQSILKEISPEYSLEGLMLKLKLQYFGHLMRRADSFEKTLMLGKIEGDRRRG